MAEEKVFLGNIRGPQGPQGEPGVAPDMSNYYTRSQTDAAIAAAVTAALNTEV